MSSGFDGDGNAIGRGSLDGREERGGFPPSSLPIMAGLASKSKSLFSRMPRGQSGEDGSSPAGESSGVTATSPGTPTDTPSVSRRSSLSRPRVATRSPTSSTRLGATLSALFTTSPRVSPRAQPMPLAAASSPRLAALAGIPEHEHEVVDDGSPARDGAGVLALDLGEAAESEATVQASRQADERPVDSPADTIVAATDAETIVPPEPRPALVARESASTSTPPASTVTSTAPSTTSSATSTPSPAPFQAPLPRTSTLDSADGDKEGEEVLPRRCSSSSQRSKGKGKLRAGLLKMVGLAGSVSKGTAGEPGEGGAAEAEMERSRASAAEEGACAIRIDMITDTPLYADSLLTDSPPRRPSNDDHDDHDDHDDGLDNQASDLIMQAVDRSKRSKRDKLSVSTSAHSSKSASPIPGGATGGALAMLGRKAASIAAGNAPPTAPNPVLPSHPVGSAAAPEITVSRTQTPPLTSPTHSLTGGSSLFFGSRGRSTRSSDRQETEAKKSKTRSISPFFRTRRRSSGATANRRDTSPPIGALSDAGESDHEVKFRPRDSAFSRANKSDRDSDGSGSDSDAETETEYDDDLLSREVMDEEGYVADVFDEVTEKNTELNAVYLEGDAGGLGGTLTPGGDTASMTDSFGEEVEQDILGEGKAVNAM